MKAIVDSKHVGINIKYIMEHWYNQLEQKCWAACYFSVPKYFDGCRCSL